MAVVKMSIKQYNDFREAKKNGDEERAAKIMSLGYQPEYDETLLDATEASIEEDEDSVEDDLAAGIDDKEICEKYGISRQKLSAIKRRIK